MGPAGAAPAGSPAAQSQAGPFDAKAVVAKLPGMTGPQIAQLQKSLSQA